MNDFLDLFEQFQDIHEMKGLIDDVRKLREHYYNHEYQKMYQLIDSFRTKYPIELTVWNSTHTIPPQNAYESFISAEEFLNKTGLAILAKYGIKLSNER